MPAGPAIGRVEAKRRALTTPSTAPASNARWCRRTIRMRQRARVLRENMAHVRGPIARVICRLRCLKKHDTTQCTRAARFSCTNCAAQTATRGTTNDGVNDPVSAAWGHAQGRTAGSFTPSLVAATATRAPGSEAAQSAASMTCSRQVAAIRDACTRFAVMGLPGVRERLERASKLGGQPDAIFAWPPSWPRRRGPSCR